MGGHLGYGEEDQSPPSMEETALVWPGEQSRWPVLHTRQSGNGRCGVRKPQSQAPVALFCDPCASVNSLQLEQTPAVKRHPSKLPVPWAGRHISVWEVNLLKLRPPGCFLLPRRSWNSSLWTQSFWLLPLAQSQPRAISQEHSLCLLAD